MTKRKLSRSDQYLLDVVSEFNRCGVQPNEAQILEKMYELAGDFDFELWDVIDIPESRIIKQNFKDWKEENTKKFN